MKKIIACLLALLPLCTLCQENLKTAFQPNDTGIHFTNTSFEEALQVARDVNKMVFIDFYTVPCGPCIMLEKEIFPRAKAGETYNSQFISLRIDIRTEEGKKLSALYNTGPYPTLLFTDDRGQEVFRQIGAENLTDFLQAAEKTQRVRRLIRSIDTVKKHISNRQFIPEEMDAYSVYLRSNMTNLMSENDSANLFILNLYRDYFATQSYEQLYTVNNLNIIFNLGEYLDLRSREYHFLLNNRRTFYQYFSPEAVNEKLIVVPQRQDLSSLNLQLAEAVLYEISRVANEHKINFAAFSRYPDKTSKTSTGYFIMRGMPDLYLDLYKANNNREEYIRTTQTAFNDNKNDFFILANLAWSFSEKMLSLSATRVYDTYAKQLSKAQPSMERYPFILSAYGLCLARSGKKVQAIDALQKSLAQMKKNGNEFPPAEKLLKALEAKE